MTPSVWDELEKLLAGPCQDFDIVQVDTASAQPDAGSAPPLPPDAGGRVCPHTDLPLYPHAGV
eukprot:CAMPEP_0179277074 /NCGR_PEP_ID=MMETSP0797-20121207/34905_1 /TAXON_ID=47934 /ORGANISM="Dinophysis acuminata, Strain DAEP01" /LENGTH=62 /DNA_ID=CAMNT_0020985649 /DNA_START=61 /DNA_END=246 /DNA_ORIENTATION=+